MTALGLRVGDLVEVRSEDEILATLDERGQLDDLPFMPEMRKFCGKRLRVQKVANKLCDTMTGTGMRRMRDAVHLVEARCDGSAHGGCQTACSLYWKEAWLKRADPASGETPAPVGSGRLLPILEVNTHREPGPDGEERFRCQSTQLLEAAPERLPLRDLGQYVEDVRVGNTSAWVALRTVLFFLFNRYQRLSTKFPRPLRIKNGMEWGFVAPGTNTKTPTGVLALQPGELVRIKSRDEIVATLDAGRRNRGLGFEEEMARFCGRTARVRTRVDRCIDETTGRMLQMKNPCIVLDDVVCMGVYKANCPREILSFWREIWLERIDESR
jgi:hypothetical protein